MEWNEDMKLTLFNIKSYCNEMAVF